MRILHVVPTYFPAIRYGGPIHSVHGLCAGLAGLGHEVHVVTTSVDGHGDSDVPHGRAVELDGVKVWYFTSKVMRRLYYSPPMARALKGMLGDFDLLHVHSVFLWPTSIAARAADRAGVPYLVSPRGMLVGELIERRSSYVKNAWLTLVESRTLARAHAVHLTSQRELEDAKQLPLPLPSPFVLPNGVTLPTLELEAGASVPPGVQLPYALFLGRIHWVKGLDRALQALAGTEIRLVLCGNDEDGYRSQLERLVWDLGLQRQVHFEGPVSGARKWTLLAKSRFVLMPSYNENFGNVVIEAMSVARPVVATETVGASEIIREAGAGLVSGGSVEALRTAMNELWFDATLADRLGAAGHRHVKSHLLWPQVAQRMAEQYTVLIARSPGSVMHASACQTRAGSC